MRFHSVFPALLFSAALLAHGQDDPSDAPKPPDTGVGNYSVVITTLEPSAATHLLNPAIVVPVDAATRVDPKDVTGTLQIPAQFAIESLGNPRYLCMPKVTRDHGCDNIDRADLTIRDKNTIEYHVINHGAAAQLQINVDVHDVVPVSHTGEKTVWHANDVIFVSVPAATPLFHPVSAVLVGEWDHEAVVFEVGKPLPPAAKKALDDLGVHQDLGDKVLYSYRVKEPAKAKQDPAKAAPAKPGAAKR